MAAPQFACHACRRPISGDALHSVVNISPTLSHEVQTFAYFCECVGDVNDHAGLREQHKLPEPEPEPEAEER